MPTLQEQLQTAVDQTTADSNTFHDIVHGDTTTEVATENGNVKSVAKVVAENQQTLADSIATLTAMRDESVASAASAASSETNSATSEGNAATSEANTLAAVGAVANKYLFDDTVVMDDPTAGVLNFDNADLSLATNLAISAQTAETTAPDISDFINTWSTSTSTVKGVITVKKVGAPQVFALFAVTGDIVDNTEWLQVSLLYITGSGAFALSDEIYISFTKTGDKGDGDLVSVNNLSDVADAVAARNNLGLVIGSNVQAYDANTAKTNVAQAFTAAQGFAETTLVDNATINWDVSANQVSKLTLGGNRTLNAPTNQVAGKTYLLRVIQDATGSRSLAFSSAYKFPGGEAPSLSTDANAVDVLTFVSDGSNMYGVMQGGFA